MPETKSLPVSEARHSATSPLGSSSPRLDQSIVVADAGSLSLTPGPRDNQHGPSSAQKNLRQSRRRRAPFQSTVGP